MTDRANIALVGMMGSGKTAVGRLLAARLGMRFIDTDAEVVRRAGRSIAAIFERDGEEAFRALETEALRLSAAGEGCVIATGGGVVTREENRAILRERCWTVWLTATPEEHVRRSEGGARRPLLEGPEDRLETVRRLLEQRAPFYALADETVETSGRTPGQVADELASLWRTVRGEAPQRAGR